MWHKRYDNAILMKGIVWLETFWLLIWNWRWWTNLVYNARSLVKLNALRFIRRILTVNKYHYSIVALSRCTVCLMRQTTFLRLVKLYRVTVSFRVVYNDLRDSPITVTLLYEIIVTTIYRHQRTSVTPRNVITLNMSKIRLNRVNESI